MWVGFKVFFHLNELLCKNYIVEKAKKNGSRFVPQHSGIYGN